MNELILPVLVAVALAVVCGFWYSYYQSVKKLKAHDRETVAIMERDLLALEQSGASPDAIAAARQRLTTFRQRHAVR